MGVWLASQRTKVLQSSTEESRVDDARKQSLDWILLHILCRRQRQGSVPHLVPLCICSRENSTVWILSKLPDNILQNKNRFKAALRCANRNCWSWAMCSSGWFFSAVIFPDPWKFFSQPDRALSSLRFSAFVIEVQQVTRAAMYFCVERGIRTVQYIWVILSSTGMVMDSTASASLASLWCR